MIDTERGCQAGGGYRYGGAVYEEGWGGVKEAGRSMRPAVQPQTFCNAERMLRTAFGIQGTFTIIEIYSSRIIL